MILLPHLSACSQDAPAGTVSTGKGWGLGVDRGPQGEAGLHPILPTLLGCHSPHTEASPVCLLEEAPHYSNIHVLSTRSGASVEGLLTRMLVTSDSGQCVGAAVSVLAPRSS